MRFLPSLSEKVKSSLQHLAPLSTSVKKMSDEIKEKEDEARRAVVKRDQYKKIYEELHAKYTEMQASIKGIADMTTSENIPSEDVDQGPTVRALRAQLMDIRAQSTEKVAHERHRH